MDTDCHIVSEASEYVAGWVERQAELKEESITDWFLDDISRKSKNIHYKQFSRHAENKQSGADWEWWILMDDLAFKYRVQAKILKEEGNEKGILYRKGAQATKLIKSAEADNAIPLYAFYNKSKKVETSCCDDSENSKRGGVFVASAERALKISRMANMANAQNLLRFSVPISCIFCCPVAPFFPVLGTWREYRGIYTDLPDYVEELVRRQESDAKFDNGELPHHKINADSLLVQDLRKER